MASAIVRCPAYGVTEEYAPRLPANVSLCLDTQIPADHIHMVIRSEPKVSPSDVMQVVKSISAREFFRLHPEVKKKYFWGGKLWTQSYFVETIGNASEEVIRKYVQDQLKVMDNGEKSSSQLGLF